MLIGLRGRPILAAAPSNDSDTLPPGEKRNEKGAAHRMPAHSAVTPAATIFDIVISLVATQELEKA